MMRIWIGLAAALLMGAAVLPAKAQSYPTKSIRIIFGFGPGGPVDVTARLLASKLGPEFGVPIVVESRPGATGHIGAGLVAKSDPDGHTLYITTPGPVTIAPHFRKDMAFHMINDFEFISAVAGYHNVLLAHPNFAKDMKTWVEKVKAAPGKYNAATNGIGALQHIYFIVQNDLLALKMEYINYNGAGPMINSVVTAENAIAFTSVVAGKAVIESGQLLPITVLSPTRSKMLPNVPTTAEQGFPEIGKAGNWFGRVFLMAPKGTPKPIVDKLNAAIHKAMQDPDFKAKFVEVDLDDLSHLSPETVRKEAAAEYENWGALIKKYDIKDQ